MENKQYKVDLAGEDPDGTIPNIPLQQIVLSIPPARANDNFDLTEMNIRAFDEDDGKSIVVRPQAQKRRVPTDPAVISKAAPRRALPLWIWIAGSGAALFVLTACAVALFLLWPRESSFTLKVLEAPAGSKVFVDGLASGVPQADGTIVVQGLRANENREVIVRHTEFDDWSTTVKGEAGKELVVTAKLTPKIKTTYAPPNEIDYTGFMELVPGGAFIMGDNKHRPDEGPEHEVTVPSFYIDKFEVTNEQYKKFCDETQRSYPPSPFWNPEYFSAEPKAPVVGVSWDDAAAYAKWAGKRLPTEEEWEKAASWDPETQKKRQWPWGNSAESNRSTLGLSRTEVRLAPVNQNPSGASAYGVQDMAGNAAEWVDAYYQPYNGNTKSDPEFGTRNRVVRGGTSISTLEDARTTRRFPRPPDYTAQEKASNAYLIGFRCAVSADDSKLQDYLKGKTR